MINWLAVVVERGCAGDTAAPLKRQRFDVQNSSVAIGYNVGHERARAPPAAATDLCRLLLGHRILHLVCDDALVQAVTGAVLLRAIIGKCYAFEFNLGVLRLQDGVAPHQACPFGSQINRLSAARRQCIDVSKKIAIPPKSNARAWRALRDKVRQWRQTALVGMAPRQSGFGNSYGHRKHRGGYVLQAAPNSRRAGHPT